MKLELIDIDNLPYTSIIDGVPIYANPIKIIGKLFLRRLELCLNFMDAPSGNVVDIGCGSGVLLPALSKINGLIVGLDIHNYLSNVYQYLKKNDFHQISLIQADSNHLPFKKSTFKTILIVSTFDHLIKPRLALNEFSRVAIPKGVAIFGIRATNMFYNIIKTLFNIIYVLTYFIIFRNYREFFTDVFKPELWRHLYPDSHLIYWISNKFRITEQKNLRLFRPVYIVIKGVKESK